MKEKTHILVVEDSLTQAKRLEHLLVKNGYDVSVARNGKEGLNKARENPPAVVITDVMMPDMDGYEMCRCIKKDEGMEGLPVIILTSLSDPIDVIRGLECGADNFLPKPYEPEHLLRRLDLVLSNLELRRAGQAQMSVEVFFAGKYHRLTADRIQIIDLLLSTFEAAVLQSTQIQKLAGDYRNALEQIKQSQANFQVLLETVNDAVVVVNSKGEIYYANPEAEILFGTSSKDLVGTTFHQSMKEGEPREIHFTRPDGTSVGGVMRVKTSNWNGETVRFVAIREHRKEDF